MIYIFRKEMKKWHAVLWVVFASMAISGFSLIFWRSTHVDEVKVASVNGEVITFKNYKRVLADTQQRISAMKEYARMLGIPEAMFLKNYYESSSSYDIALDTAIKETLLNQIKSPFNIHMASDFFKEELVKMMPQGILDEQGRINMDSYTGYLSRLATTPAEFEQNKEEEFKRQLVERFVENSYYVPVYRAKDLFEQNNATKAFSIVIFPDDRFMEEAKKSQAEEKELKALFEQNKEQYRVPEKRKALYWVLSPDDYTKQVDIDEQSIKSFYDKNRSTFRIAPKIRVRHILIKGKSSDDGLKIAQNVYQEVKQHPSKFAELAEKYSQDQATIKNGGLTDFFKRGSFDQDFEKAAFRLQKNGDISDLVKTAQGFEIIQLDERIQATEKPLEEVRDNIVKTLKGKRALAKLKSDLEIMLHNAKSDESALANFAQENKLEKNASEWVTKEMTEKQNGEKKQDLKIQLAEQLFGASKRQNRYGYFFSDDKYIIYQLADTSKSFVQNFETVRDEVLDNYYKTKARELLRNMVSEARSLIFNKKKTLHEFAQEHNLKIIQTENIKNGGKVEGLPESGDLTAKMFTLSDNAQLFQFKHDRHFFLVQLKEIEPVDAKSLDSEWAKIIKNEKLKNGHVHVSAFIASLQRNAKIEVDRNVLKAYKGN